MELDPQFIAESLSKLSSVSVDIFGASGHGFRLNSPMPESDVRELEHRHNIQLPQEYRHFLTSIADGGAGPYYGLFPWGQWDGKGSGLEPWAEAGDFVGKLSEPFPFTDAWNGVQGMPELRLTDTDEKEYWRLLDLFEEKYWGPERMNGAIPICTEGCALRVWLVLTGAESGRLWHDGRADFSGLKPVLLADGSPATCSLWYYEWLKDALRQVE